MNFRGDGMPIADLIARLQVIAARNPDAMIRSHHDTFYAKSGDKMIWIDEIKVPKEAS